MFCTSNNPWEDLKNSDYGELLKEAKKQLASFEAQIEGIHRISNVILIKKSEKEIYKASDDLPVELSIGLMEIADGLKNGLMKLELSLTRLETRLDMMEEHVFKGENK